MNPPWFGQSRQPKPDAAYVNGLLCQSLYFGDRSLGQAVARMMGGEMRGFRADAATYWPDWLVIIAQGEALVVLDGTTNLSQWIGHVGGALAAWPDRLVPTTPFGVAQVNYSFLTGAELAFADIEPIIAEAGTGPVYITGHSYGAAAAHVIGRQLANATPRPQAVNIMTFGEPRAYDGRAAVSEPDWHARIINTDYAPGLVQDVPRAAYAVDPVTLVPVPGLAFSKMPLAARFLRNYLGFAWDHHGDAWYIDRRLASFVAEPASRIVATLPVANYLDLVDNLPFAALHLMDSGYLVQLRAVWRASGLSPELSRFDGWYTTYLGHGQVVPEQLTPNVPADTLNRAYFLPGESPVTPTNLPEWSVVSARAYLADATFFGGRSDVMTMMKGTLDFNGLQGQGASAGWSESVYSSNPNDTAPSMMAKMAALLGFRMRLSVGADNVQCVNPVLPFAVRVEDELLQRDAAVLDVLSPGSTPQMGAIIAPPGFTISGGASGVARNYNQNLDLELGARIKWLSGGQLQQASPMYHGLPLYAFTDPAGMSSSSAERFPLRYTSPNAEWMQRLWAMAAFMRDQQLGFRNITGAWNGPNNTPGPFSSPDAVFYNTDKEMVELQWLPGRIGVSPQPPYFPTAIASQAYPTWPEVNSFCKLQVRRWPTFAVLQGRWPAQVVPPQTAPIVYGFALRILRKVRRPSDNTVPMVSPIAWTTWFPAQFPATFQPPPPATPLTQQQILQICCSFSFVESKKLGRPFGLERGRQRNRPT